MSLQRTEKRLREKHSEGSGVPARRVAYPARSPGRAARAFRMTRDH